MRQELVDVFFSVAEQNPGIIQEERIHRVICQSLGVGASANPYGGYRYAAGRDIRGVGWQRVYDLIVRLWPEFERAGLSDQFRDGVNRVLAAHDSAWDLGADGRLYRVLPAPAQAQVVAAVAELANPRYAPAAALFNTARDAYDDRPRRDRDACANAFDAMESVAKEKYGLPNATFGQVVAHIRQGQALNEQIVGVLEALNTLRNRNFGHGMAAPFALSTAEVDFTYLACIGGILLLTRTP
ncbi:MAG: hypothetical protein K6U09_10035 [Acidobacteriia bacterium]|jgi:hypothetical protein|nr:hypothetical protein [Terriglobia bacterium]